MDTKGRTLSTVLSTVIVLGAVAVSPVRTVFLIVIRRPDGANTLGAVRRSRRGRYELFTTYVKRKVATTDINRQ